MVLSYHGYVVFLSCGFDLLSGQTKSGIQQMIDGHTQTSTLASLKWYHDLVVSLH